VQELDGKAATGRATRAEACGDGPGGPEFEVVVLPGGAAIFSWSTADLQEIALALGRPEFEPPRWCG